MIERLGVGFAALVLTFGSLLTATPAIAAVSIRGAGATETATVIAAWQRQLAPQGGDVGYEALGESAGHVFYIEDQSDFAVSGLPFTADEAAAASHRPYRYIPLVADATAFLYHLDIDGTRVTDLRLRPSTLTLIFSGKITNWDDRHIAADNGRAFPNLPLVPVIRSDASVESYRLSEWFAQQTPRPWKALCAQTGLTPCAATASYPRFAGAAVQGDADAVASYIAASSDNGTIGYAPPRSASLFGLPMASVENPAGRSVQPLAHNVDVALSAAKTGPHGIPVLSAVYDNTRPQSYPLSYYTWMIAPTTTAPPFTTDRGELLGRFLAYALCGGQAVTVPLGFTPLPRSLVRAGLRAAAAIPGADVPHSCSLSRWLEAAVGIEPT